MNVVLKMSRPQIYTASHSAAFSLGSADGLTLYAWQDGLIAVLFGPDHALANLSARQAKERGLLTSGTYGPLGSISSELAVRNESMASRLRTLCLGSTLFRETWRQKTTPSGRLLWVHTASALRTSANDSTGWPTPKAVTGDYQYSQGDHSKIVFNLAGAEKLAIWPSPKANNHTGAGTRGDGGENLQTVVSWATPTTRDHKDGACQTADVPVNALLGRQATLSGAATASGGQLNPEHSRWLMGYPAVWDSCGATAMQSFRKTRRSS